MEKNAHHLLQTPHFVILWSFMLTNFKAKSIEKRIVFHCLIVLNNMVGIDATLDQTKILL